MKTNSNLTVFFLLLFAFNILYVLSSTVTHKLSLRNQIEEIVEKEKLDILLRKQLNYNRNSSKKPIKKQMREVFVNKPKGKITTANSRKPIVQRNASKVRPLSQYDRVFQSNRVVNNYENPNIPLRVRENNDLLEKNQESKNPSDKNIFEKIKKPYNKPREYFRFKRVDDQASKDGKRPTVIIFSDDDEFNSKQQNSKYYEDEDENENEVSREKDGSEISILKQQHDDEEQNDIIDILKNDSQEQENKNASPLDPTKNTTEVSNMDKIYGKNGSRENNNEPKGNEIVFQDTVQQRESHGGKEAIKSSQTRSIFSGDLLERLSINSIMETLNSKYGDLKNKQNIESNSILKPYEQTNSQDNNINNNVVSLLEKNNKINPRETTAESEKNELKTGELEEKTKAENDEDREITVQKEEEEEQEEEQEVQDYSNETASETDNKLESRRGDDIYITKEIENNNYELIDDEDNEYLKEKDSNNNSSMGKNNSKSKTEAKNPRNKQKHLIEAEDIENDEVIKRIANKALRKKDPRYPENTNDIRNTLAENILKETSNDHHSDHHHNHKKNKHNKQKKNIIIDASSNQELDLEGKNKEKATGNNLESLVSLDLNNNDKSNSSNYVNIIAENKNKLLEMISSKRKTKTKKNGLLLKITSAVKVNEDKFKLDSNNYLEVITEEVKRQLKDEFKQLLNTLKEEEVNYYQQKE